MECNYDVLKITSLCYYATIATSTAGAARRLQRKFVELPWFYVFIMIIWWKAGRWHFARASKLILFSVIDQVKLDATVVTVERIGPSYHSLQQKC